MIRLPAFAAAAALLILSSAPVAALAWGIEGHRLIAEVAAERLTPTARAEVLRLLQLEPGASLATISTWADEVRDQHTARWHYVNFRPESACHYEPSHICTGGGCVVGAIEQQAQVLASTAPDVERLRALKYLVHFVGDVHQPLHGGRGADKGGNTFQVQAFDRGTNLHALWDTGMLQHWPGGASALRAAVELEQTIDDQAASPAEWAEESCRIVETDGFYPSTHTLDPIYTQRWSATVIRRMATASQRLAAMLNQSLGRPPAQRSPKSAAR